MATAREHEAPQGPLRHQADRRARRATRRSRAHQLQRAVGAARPDRARPRRDHRHRHLRHHRRGDRRRRPGDHPVVRPRRRHLRVLRALLRRAGVDDPGLRQRLHVLLRDDGRARRVDHRLGPDPRVRASRSPPSRSAGASTSTSCSTRCSASRCPTSLANPPGEDGGAFNLPAVFIVLAVTALLMRRRARERARQHDHGGHQARDRWSLFIVARRHRRSTRGNLTPFAPEGLDGVVTAASVIFFAYIGFDAISTSGEEAKNPGATCRSRSSARSRSRPCSTSSSRSSPSARCRSTSSTAPRRRSPTVLKDGAGLRLGRATIISFGALVAITSVVLTILYGQTRIMFAMCRDGLMPRGFAKVNEKTPHARSASPPPSAS